MRYQNHTFWAKLECFLEGIAFTLTLQDDIVAGFTVLFAMIMKLIPQKLGNAVILMQSGLNHFWESVLNFAAVSAIYIGLKFGFLLFQMQKYQMQNNRVR